MTQKNSSLKERFFLDNNTFNGIIRKVRYVRNIFGVGNMTENGSCSKMKIVYGVITVSDKGQIVIPADLRKNIDIKQGDKLIVLKRKDEAGFTVLKLDKMDELMHKIQEDEEFYKKIGGDRDAKM